jgi:TRAP-type C4-dicarboxylate transport system permease small subunit
LLSGDVVLRELTGNGIPWSHQAGLYANLIVAVFGMGLAAAAGTHLRPRFADGWLPDAWQASLQRLSYLVTALFLLGFAVLGVQLVAETLRLGEIASVLRIPLWPMQALIPLGFTATALRYGCYALHPQLAPEQG